MAEAKPYAISKQVVWEAYQRVKANRGAAGVDGESIEAFEHRPEEQPLQDLESDVLGQLLPAAGASRRDPRRTTGACGRWAFPRSLTGWRRWSSRCSGAAGGTALPSGLLRVSTRASRRWMRWRRRGSGAGRPTGSSIWISKASLTICRMTWSSAPWRTTRTAVGPAVHRAVAAGAGAAAGRYPGRADEGHAAGRRDQSAPGESLPALCVRRLDAADFPDIPFERYADDVIVHCQERASKRRRCWRRSGAARSSAVWSFILRRPRSCTARTTAGPGSIEHIKFDFLGYTFRPRRAKNRRGKWFVSFLPAISNKAAKAIRQTIRDWRLAATRNNQCLEDLARL